jgi:hypothetical protein
MPLLKAPDEQMLICGMSMGYPQREAVINSYRTERLDAGAFTTFLRD